MKKRTVIVTGLAAAFPVGGVFWDYVQYLLGFLRMGHDAYYLEDSGGWTFDPDLNTYTDNAAYSVRYLTEHMRRLGPELEGRWCFRDTHDNHWGLGREEFQAVVDRADVFINISATCQLRDEYRKIPVKALIDSDPLYTQTDVPGYVDGTAPEPTCWLIDQMRGHDIFFSFGENVGQDFCTVPPEVFNWIPTRQPIVLDCWETALKPRRDVFTTVLSWKPKEKNPTVRGVQYGGKNMEFEKFMDLPGHTKAELELALGGGAPEDEMQRVREMLRGKGWKLVGGFEMSRDPWIYRDYIRDSLAEFSLAKNAYVATNSGWFSCRSACYMAAARPVVVQDTMFSRFIPTGEGILAFRNMDEAAAAVESVRADWDRHSRAARRLAEEWFDAPKVLGAMLKAMDA